MFSLSYVGFSRWAHALGGNTTSFPESHPQVPYPTTTRWDKADRLFLLLLIYSTTASISRGQRKPPPKFGTALISTAKEREKLYLAARPRAGARGNQSISGDSLALRGPLLDPRLFPGSPVTITRPVIPASTASSSSSNTPSSPPGWYLSFSISAPLVASVPKALRRRTHSLERRPPGSSLLWGGQRCWTVHSKLGNPRA